MQGSAQILKLQSPLRGYLNIGGTPLADFASLSSEGVRVCAKLEWHQAGSSVKARAANQIIRAAQDSGKLREGITLLDASSGNTAIAYATLLQRLHLKATICLPSNASEKRISTLRSLGADLVLTSPFEGTEGAQAVARELFMEHPERFFYADQYSNPANWQAHHFGTGREILEQTGGKVTHFVAGLGTTGTFTGTTRRLKEYHPGIQAIALQPDSPMHGLEGWKHLATASMPKIYDDTLADACLEISSEEAYEMIRYIARHEGYLLSPSAAANLVGAVNVARQLDHGVVVTVLPDSLERYDEVSEHVFGKIFDAITI